MKIIIDECLPKKLLQLLSPHTAWTIPQIGLAGKPDSEILSALDQREIDIFITIDGNIEYQQQFSKRKFGTIIIRSATNRFQDLQHLKNELLVAINQVAAGAVLRIPAN